MSVLGCVFRVKPENVHSVCIELQNTEGVEVGLNPGDGRIVLVIEDTPRTSAAQTFAAISLLDDVVGASLVYEYSGPDIDGFADTHEETRYQSWRTTMAELARDHPLLHGKA